MLIVGHFMQLKCRRSCYNLTLHFLISMHVYIVIGVQVYIHTMINLFCVQDCSRVDAAYRAHCAQHTECMDVTFGTLTKVTLSSTLYDMYSSYPDPICRTRKVDFKTAAFILIFAKFVQIGACCH